MTKIWVALSGGNLTSTTLERLLVPLEYLVDIFLKKAVPKDTEAWDVSRL